MSARAPSPWTHGQATEFGTFHANTVYAADGLAVAQVYELPNNTTVEEVDPARWAGGLANARLIAAAPDLLTVAHMVVGGCDADSLYAAALAAVNKATGGQP